MTSELVNKWVEALRSDRYVQATGTFIHKAAGSEYCCVVGVLMSECQFDPDTHPVIYFFRDKDTPEKFVSMLYKLNDCGISFDALATFIETELDESTSLIDWS